jgi:heme/copper-type cytochrome/quinol oxidase subunit 3
VTTLSENNQHTAETRPNLVAVGTIVWLSSELMFFAALFAMYFTVRQVSGPAVWLESTEILNSIFFFQHHNLGFVICHLPVRSICCRAFPTTSHRFGFAI